MSTRTGSRTAPMRLNGSQKLYPASSGNQLAMAKAHGRNDQSLRGGHGLHLRRAFHFSVRLDRRRIKEALNPGLAHQIRENLGFAHGAKALDRLR